MIKLMSASAEFYMNISLYFAVFMAFVALCVWAHFVYDIRKKVADWINNIFWKSRKSK